MNYLELLYNGEYDELVRQTLPVLETDKEAERAFLRLFLQKSVVLLLCPHSTMQGLHKEADKGNKYAQYAVARRVAFENDMENAMWVAFRQMSDAADQGLPDAIAGLALTYEFGDIGFVDHEKADEMMDKAQQMGSELALRSQLKDLCFGFRFQDAQPQRAIEMANRLIADDEAKGIDPNGLWYYYRGCAVEATQGRMKAVDDYKRALELGVLQAYADLIIAAGYGDSTDTLSENEQYHDYLLKGMAARYSGAFFLEGARMLNCYSVMQDTFREKNIDLQGLSYDILQDCHEAIHALFSQAARLGDMVAWEQLGDMYYEGTYGFQQDYENAFACYSNGVKQESAACMEKLWKMMHDHLIDRPLDYVDQVTLWGARHESKRLLAEVVIAHQEGRLTRYHDEISKYYEPVFDAPDFTLDDDEDEEDDGRFDAFA